MQALYRITINEAIKLDCQGPDKLGLKKNDWCIVSCNRFEDYGRVTHIGEIPEAMDLETISTIKRRSTLVDQGIAHENSVRSKSFHRKAMEAIKKSRLPMKLYSTHYSFDRSLIIFNFTSMDRVDFRDLMKNISQDLGKRIEFRQIKPRDFAGLIGGVETCGRVLCCATFLTNFVSINMKMAKDQGLSLNPSSITGACGRLKCCLSYEHEGYKLLMDSMPKIGSKCQCQGCEGKVVENNLLMQTVKVSLDGGTRMITVPVDQISCH